MSSSKRGTGQTTKQLRAAPLNAVFVWCNNNIHYPIALARSLNRTDIKIVGPNWIESENWQGMKLSGVIIDHAARLTDGQSATHVVIQSKINIEE